MQTLMIFSSTAMSEKSKIVAVFIYDGTEKYSAMTVNAIKSFLAASQGTVTQSPPNLQ